MPLTELSFLGLVATALITALLISFVATPVGGRWMCPRTAAGCTTTPSHGWAGWLSS